MANVYIETMEEDLVLLKESLQNKSDKIASTLSIVHKIKGGALQIGLSSISQSAVVTEYVGKLESPEYTKALSKLADDLEQSIIDVEHWKNNNSK